MNISMVIVKVLKNYRNFCIGESKSNKKYYFSKINRTLIFGFMPRAFNPPSN